VELFARDQGPLFDTYSGRSDLGGWLRAIVVHEGVRRSKKQRREVTPEGLEELPMPDVELSALKGAYGPQFTQALSSAFAALTVEQRNLLRQSFLDGLSIDVLAKLLDVHRATAARRVQAARQALVDGVRAKLKESLKLGDETVDELITLGNLEQSLSGILRKTNS
jgi:RNA polymerase sigma-70 factor (ECF subfamily)